MLLVWPETMAYLHNGPRRGGALAGFAEGREVREDGRQLLF